MGLNYSTLVYLPAYDIFAIPITINPIVSQNGGAVFAARGIFDTRTLDVMAEDGSIVAEQQTVLDVREAEFTVVPKQGDRINIPVDSNGAPQGDFEVANASTNGGGETTLILKRVVVPLP